MAQHQVLYPALVYSNIFEDFNDVSIDALIKNIPTINALKLVSDIGARIYFQELVNGPQEYYYNILTTLIPEPYKAKFIDFFNNYYKVHQARLMVVNNLYNVTLIDYLVSHSNGLKSDDNLDVESQLSLFKAYLYLGELRLKHYEDGKISDGLTDRELAEVLLPNQLFNAEMQLRKNFIVQSLKAKVFFEFCEKNENFKDYLRDFLRYRKVESWQYYITTIIQFYFQLLGTNSENTHSTIKIENINEKRQVLIDFLNSLVLNINECKPKPDYLNIRTHPIVKYGDDGYMVLNFNFLIDKLFQTVQFDFANVLIGLQLEYKGKVIQNYVDFKTRVYGAEFSEYQLLYSVMENFLSKQKVNSKATGEQMKPDFKGGEPDYYYRDKSKVFFFEFKDTNISAKAKYSRNFQDIYLELEKKFIYYIDKKGKFQNKGVSQLANVIKNFLTNGRCNFDLYNGPKMFFPVLVVTDELFTQIGFNFILNKEFEKKLVELGIDKKGSGVKNMTIITLDFFIEYQELFNRGDLKLKKLIMDYHEYVKNSKYAYNRLESFDVYVKNHINFRAFKPVRGNVNILLEILKEVLDVDTDSI